MLSATENVKELNDTFYIILFIVMTHMSMAGLHGDGYFRQRSRLRSVSE